MYTRPSITQLPTEPRAGHLIQTTNKTKTQTQSSADRTIISLSPAAGVGGTTHSLYQNTSTCHTLHKTYTNHRTDLRRAETKRKKEFNLEVSETDTSDTISLKKKKKKEK